MLEKFVPLIPVDGIKQRTLSLDGNDILVGDHTGKCYECGSEDLWDDMTAYGCNDCNWIRFTGDLTPAPADKKSTS